MSEENKRELTDEFVAALNKTRDVASNSYLSLLSESVKAVELASLSDTVLSQYVIELRDIVAREYFALDGEYTNKFVQTLGEAHFHLLCAERGILLNRIPEGKTKTPDSRFSTKEIDIFFEVKTLSVVDGDRGINTALNNSVNANIGLEKQLRSGKKIASTESVVQPYGERPYRRGTITAVIETLIEKLQQNIKLGQFSNPYTFLVVNLSLIPPFRTDNCVIRPAYCDDYLFNKAMTGDLWMTAFAKPGMLIHGCPEFEGKPCIEGVISKSGILADPDYLSIAGMLFMVYPWRNNPEIYGVYRSSNLIGWEDKSTEVFETLYTLTDINWNDDKDSNGWQLQGDK